MHTRRLFPMHRACCHQHLRMGWMVVSLLVLGLLGFSHWAWAQTDDLTLSLSRSWGYGGPKGRIQGTFTFHVRGPDDLTSVAFYIDDQKIGELHAPPWKLRFQTDDYPLGEHRLYAIGTTRDGRTLRSNVLIRTFVPKSEGWRLALAIAIPIILLTILIPALLYWIDRRRQPGKYTGYSGPFGGAICPHCGCPFARHWWGLNFGSKKYDRCPHCGKWSLVGRASPEALRAAAMACGLESPPETPASSAPKHPSDWKQRLEDSRYE